jgi:hypothetical protein
VNLQGLLAFFKMEDRMSMPAKIKNEKP